MQRLGAAPGRTAVHYDPVQRSEQWKQVILKEETHYQKHGGTSSRRPPLVPGATAIGTNHSSIKQALALKAAGKHVTGDGLSTARSSVSRRSRGGAGGGASTSRSSVRSGSVSRYTESHGGMTGRSGRSGRSMASSRSGGSSVFSFGGSSLPSSASGMTAVALARLEKLEKTLDEERSKRLTAESQLESLRRTVEERLADIGGGADSARSGRSARSGGGGAGGAR